MDGALVLGWKVHRRVHGEWCLVKGAWLSCTLRSASGRFLSESKGLLITAEYLAPQKVTWFVLSPNIDGSSFTHHHTWLVK